MPYEQITLFYPKIIKVGEILVQSIATQTFVLNPNNDKWNLFQHSNALGGGWTTIIQEKRNFGLINPDIHFTIYASYKEFFELHENSSDRIPYITEDTYLTAAGAAQHNVFYAIKKGFEYKNFGGYKYGENIVPIRLKPNGQIVELTPDTTIPQRFKPVDDPDVQSNLHLVKQALCSSSPDAALLLLTLMVEISIQSFGSITPGVDMTLGMFVDQNVDEVDKNGTWHITPTQMKMLREFTILSDGWWNFTWDEGQFTPQFQPH
jgi:hypothetical protein